MFGKIVNNIYELFHQANEFATNISVKADNNSSESFGRIDVEFYYNKSFIPIGYVTLSTERVEQETTKRPRNLCYIEEVQLSRRILIQDYLLILTKLTNATEGIFKKTQEENLWSFETAIVIDELSVIDVEYSDEFQTYIKRPNGTLITLDVISNYDNMKRSYSIDDEMRKNNNFMCDIGSSQAPILDMVKPLGFEDDSKLISELHNKYTEWSAKLNGNILAELIKYHTKISKLSNSIKIGG